MWEEGDKRRKVTKKRKRSPPGLTPKRRKEKAAKTSKRRESVGRVTSIISPTEPPFL